MNCNLLPATGMAALTLLLIGCTVEVNEGPFTIRDDQELIRGKAGYLQSVERAGTADRLPNIVLILADDLGKHDISVYNPEGVPTPSLERLAASGVTFQVAYSTCSICSPSRASLMTGRYQQRFGFERQPMNRYPHGRLEYWFVDRFLNTNPMQLVSPMSSPERADREKQGIPSSEILLPEILHQRGYRTGIFGKWHLGIHDSFLPGQRGFEEQFGFYEAFTRYAPERTPGLVEHRHDYFADRHIWRQKRKGSCAIRENGRVISDPGYLTFSIAQRACDFITENKGSPFFLYIPFSAPHTPFQVPEEYDERFQRETDPNKRVYYGMISALDDAIGMILERLDSHGLSGNTLIIVASDNGGATYTGATDNGILRGGKFTQFEGGINIPLIFSWEGRLPEGAICKHPVSLMDLFTTCVTVTGTGLPGDREIDGRDLVPLLTGKDPGIQTRALFWRTDHNRAMRQGPWKMVWNERDGQQFLFNLETDPGETTDLAPGYPELLEEFREIYQEWESEMKEPLWPGVMEFRFDQGEVTTLWAI